MTESESELRELEFILRASDDRTELSDERLQPEIEIWHSLTI